MCSSDEFFQNTGYSWDSPACGAQFIALSLGVPVKIWNIGPEEELFQNMITSCFRQPSD